MSDLIPEPKKIYVQRPSNSYVVFYTLAEFSTGVEPLYPEKYIRRIVLNTENK